MKKILFLCIFLCMLVMAHAQKVYFIYLQSDNHAPFYVKMGEKVYSSSPVGYLILPKLKDSTYTFTVGRPAAQTAEPHFSVTVNGGDKGFLIKDLDNGLALFDLHSMALVRPLTTSAGTASTTKKTDAFTRLLSEAANDTSLLEVPVAAKEEEKVKAEKPAPEKSETIAATQPVMIESTAALKGDSSTEIKINIQQEAQKPGSEATKTVTIAPPETAPPVNDTAAIARPKEPIQLNQPASVEQINYKRSVVTRRSESSTTEGFGLVFLDNQDGVIDTIRLLIPNPKTTILQESESKKEELTTEKSLASAKQNPACRAVATESDFFRLRRDMATKNHDYNMIDEARKVFRKKCFTTEQIRNLSTLFLTAEGKYNFFDAAYQFTSDPGNFSTLETELKNDNYVKRFKALVGQ